MQGLPIDPDAPRYSRVYNVPLDYGAVTVHAFKLRRRDPRVVVESVVSGVARGVPMLLTPAQARGVQAAINRALVDVGYIYYRSDEG